DVVLAYAIDARIADVHGEREARSNEHGRQRRRHALLLGIELGHAEHHVTGVLHARLEESADLPHALRITCDHPFDEAIEVARGAVDPHGELLDGLAARDLALVVAADPISDDIEPPLVVAKEGVFVDLTLPPDVATRHR